MSVSSRYTLPAMRGISPKVAFSAVDLPAPLGPIRVTTWETDAWKLIPSTIGALP